MPYAQLHYPFENKEKFERNFPADFIAEGLDQVGLMYRRRCCLVFCVDAMYQQQAGVPVGGADLFYGFLSRGSSANAGLAAKL